MGVGPIAKQALWSGWIVRIRSRASVPLGQSHDLKCSGTGFTLVCHIKASAIELNGAATKLQQEFYTKFPPCDLEKEYKFITSSTMKPTQIRCAPRVESNSARCDSFWRYPVDAVLRSR